MVINRGYELIRSRRKTIAIRITPDARVEVRAPLRTPVAQVEKLLQEKADWIDRHQAEVARRIALRVAYQPEQLPLLGTEYPLHRAKISCIRFDGTSFIVPEGDLAALRQWMEQFYRAFAGEHLRKRVAWWSERMGVCPTGVRINGAKTRWGSCSGKNGLNFSWRLVLAEAEAVDYVVVHELAHTRHHNHGAEFWAEVARWMPDFERRRAALRGWESRLLEQGW